MTVLGAVFGTGGVAVLFRTPFAASRDAVEAVQLAANQLSQQLTTAQATIVRLEAENLALHEQVVGLRGEVAELSKKLGLLRP